MHSKMTRPTFKNDTSHVPTKEVCRYCGYTIILNAIGMMKGDVSIMKLSSYMVQYLNKKKPETNKQK